MNSSHPITKASHILVGIGASAGGLQALTSFFENVPKKSYFSYIIVQHLSPDHKSLMAELLQKHTALPVQEITNQTKILPNRVYLIPPSKNLFIDNGYLQLLEKPRDKKLNLPIDLFFESMANYSGAKCVGIVLSGTGSDGSRGLRFLKEKGGITMVQQPEQAAFDGMPQSAIDTGIIDFILPTEKMNDEVENYFSTPLDEKQSQVIDEVTLKRILLLVRQNTDLDFTLYKKPTLLRRLERRIRVLKLNTMKEYLSYITKQTAEIEILQKEFLIGVTKFFRDTQVWEILEYEIIPQIVATKQDGDILKVWEVGCSTGEETFSIGMLFLEEIKKQNKEIVLKIFASDISQHHLDIASAAEYEEGIVADVSSERLERFFLKKGSYYKVKDQLRKTAIFSNHNILKDPPFKNMDLVMCRNLLIYLQSDVQKRVIKLLHYATIVKGVLVLGTSETLGEEATYFETISRKWRVYRNQQITSSLRSEVLKSTIDKLQPTVMKSSENEKRTIAVTKEKYINTNELSSSVLDQLGASSVLVDEDFTILDAQGSFNKFAQLPTQGFSTNLLEMLEEGLKTAVTSAVRKAKRTNKQVFYKEVTFKKRTKKVVIDLLVKPSLLGDSPIKSRYTTITFLETIGTHTPNIIIENASSHNTATGRIADLEEELQKAQNDLKTSLSQRETTYEELQATNEELLASNEELQSTNEELQSVNEELHTVNAEHVQKVEELATLNSDMDNLLNSIEIGTVFIDKDFNIRKFTPAIKDHFKLLERDIGRPIDDFIFHFDHTKQTIVENSKKVMETGATIERYIENSKGEHFLKRISPFIGADGNIHGAVISFIEITHLHNSQADLRKSETKFKEFYENDPVMHISINPETGIILECNTTFVHTLKYTSKTEILGTTIYSHYSEKSKVKAVKLIEQFKEKGKVVSQEMNLMDKERNKIPVLLNSEAVYDESGAILHSRSTMIDISELRKSQIKLKERKDELERLNKDLEQFVSICSHDLQEPLATIRFSSDFLIKKFTEELSPKGKEYVGYIHASSGRMAEQIKALLEHSRIGQNVKKTKVNTKELVEVVKYDLKKRIDETNAVIHIGKLPRVKAYKTELRLLFQNLLSNALKYTKNGTKPQIRVNAYEEENYWTFSITDNGIGIKEQDIKSIFTIFSRVPTDDHYDGTGVGLAHCEKIVRLHEGTIWVESQFNVGSTFYFKLRK